VQTDPASVTLAGAFATITCRIDRGGDAMQADVQRRLRARLSPHKKRASRLLLRVMRQATTSMGSVNDYGYVFIVTYGRSGSTLLMGLLNAIPGYRIRGENHNVLYRLYQADAAIAKAYDQFSGSAHLVPRSSWYGMPLVRPHLFRAELVENLVNNVLRPEPGDRVLGFKEIRYTPVHLQDLTAYLEFIRQAFPNCKIVFNHRDPAAVASSAWWVNVEGAEEKVRAADERLLTYPADERHFHFFYDQTDDSLDNVRALMAFLDEDFDETAMRDVLQTTHGPFSSDARAR
jgi:hypothetical protein